MPKVEIYTWKTCPFCMKAKALLDTKGVEYIEHSVDGDEEARDKMAARGTDGKRSVPQIYINDQHIAGGCDGLYKMDAEGTLDGMLKALS